MAEAHVGSNLRWFLSRGKGMGLCASSQSWVGNSSTRLTSPKPSTMLATARTMRTLPLILCLPVLAGTAFGGEPNVVLENASFRYRSEEHTSELQSLRHL